MRQCSRSAGVSPVASLGFCRSFFAPIGLSSPCAGIGGLALTTSIFERQLQDARHAFGMERGAALARLAEHVRGRMSVVGAASADFVPVEVADLEDILKERDACGVRCCLTERSAGLRDFGSCDVAGVTRLTGRERRL